jgi:hypothetical protein
VQKHGALLQAWYAYQQDQAASLNRIIDELNVPIYIYSNDEPAVQTAKEEQKEKKRTLLAAMKEIAGERNDINTRRLGTWISAKAGRIINGLRFEQQSTHAGAATWKVVK